TFGENLAIVGQQCPYRISRWRRQLVCRLDSKSLRATGGGPADGQRIRCLSAADQHLESAWWNTARDSSSDVLRVLVSPRDGGQEHVHRSAQGARRGSDPGGALGPPQSDF